jgi:hypothetical protein
MESPFSGSRDQRAPALHRGVAAATTATNWAPTPQLTGMGSVADQNRGDVTDPDGGGDTDDDIDGRSGAAACEHGQHRRRRVQRHQNRAGRRALVRNGFARRRPRRRRRRAERDIGPGRCRHLDIGALCGQPSQFHAGISADINRIEEHLHRVEVAGRVVPDGQADPGACRESVGASCGHHRDRHRPVHLRQHGEMRIRLHHLFVACVHDQRRGLQSAADRYGQRLVRNHHGGIARAQHVDRHQN